MRLFAFRQIVQFLRQLSDLEILLNHDHHESDRDDWPDDAEDPNIDRIIAHAEQPR